MHQYGDLTLYTAYHVMVFGVRALTSARLEPHRALALLHDATYEIIPNAWYSFTALLLIRPRRPCCMPRSKRSTATLFDGYDENKEAVRSEVK